MSQEDDLGNSNKLLNALSVGGLYAPRGLPGLGLLGGIHYQKPELTSMWYHDKPINLDGVRYVNCRFDRCVLLVNSMDIELIDCLLDEACVIHYADPVAKILRLFLSRYSWGTPDHFNEFYCPVRNPNGSITVAGRL